MVQPPLWLGTQRPHAPAQLPVIAVLHNLPVPSSPGGLSPSSPASETAMFLCLMEEIWGEMSFSPVVVGELLMATSVRGFPPCLQLQGIPDAFINIITARLHTCFTQTS